MDMACDGTCTRALSDLTDSERRIKALERQLEEIKLHLSEFTDRTIAAETNVGDLRKALRRVEADVRGHVPSTGTEFILGVLEDTK